MKSQPQNILKNSFIQTLLFLTVFLFACTQQEEIENLEVVGVQNPVISLNGTCKFTITPPEKFWENEVDFQSWSDIEVPGECQMQGFAIKHDQAYIYKQQFEIPADFKSKQIQLNFYGVYSYARVWVKWQFCTRTFWRIYQMELRCF